MRIPFFTFFFSCIFLFGDIEWNQVQAQIDSMDTERLQDYNWRIMQRKLNDIYIPSDLEDAMQELSEISSDEALAKFKGAPEEDIGRRLFFGLGKWITTNWQLYEGSRISHYLRSLGLTHPDDMVIFLIESFHRYLNARDLEIDKRVKDLQERRMVWIQNFYQIDTIRPDSVIIEDK